MILISDHQNRRGTGKSTLSLQLANALDRTDEGITPEKAHISPEELMEAYTEQPPGSALVLDEAEAGIGSRDAMTHINKVFNRLLAMGRVEEKYLILNAPSSNKIDKGIKEMADIWCLVEARGRARVYRFISNPFDGGLYQKAIEELHWADISDPQLVETYAALTEEKRARLRGDEGEDFIRASEVEERIEKARKAERIDQREKYIVNMVDSLGMKYGDVAMVLPQDVSVSKERVGQIYRETTNNE
ncbi:hypothetical protein AArcMg_0677 [Natrarchaeobaculum sulfurireducens]|uniref:Uncharacterized protein n=1 Tax=Natrarchaeobaculum sulfurireducens TaxID=2044521 RepID=A0A346PMF4_9EURY|nr:hypothetical protein AArcMg_0677 [Natrarchaeobaculum sulfurireducens]